MQRKRRNRRPAGSGLAEHSLKWRGGLIGAIPARKLLLPGAPEPVGTQMCVGECGADRIENRNGKPHCEGRKADRN